MTPPTGWVAACSPSAGSVAPGPHALAGATQNTNTRTLACCSRPAAAIHKQVGAGGGMKGGVNVWQALRDTRDVHPAWARVEAPYTEHDMPRRWLDKDACGSTWRGALDRDAGCLTDGFKMPQQHPYSHRNLFARTHAAALLAPVTFAPPFSHMRPRSITPAAKAAPCAPPEPGAGAAGGPACAAPSPAVAPALAAAGAPAGDETPSDEDGAVVVEAVAANPAPARLAPDKTQAAGGVPAAVPPRGATACAAELRRRAAGTGSTIAAAVAAESSAEVAEFGVSML